MADTGVATMKMEWVLEWDITVDGKKVSKKRIFKSFNEAKAEIRKLITSSCNDHNYIMKAFSYLLEASNYPNLRKALAWFAFSYLTQEEFSYYSKIDKLSNSLEKADIHPETYISNDNISFYNNYGDMVLSTDMVLMEDEKKYYSLFLSTGIPGGIESLEIRLTPREYKYDKAAYPLLVLKTLTDSETHLDQREIAHALTEKHHFVGERKAIGRHINLLKELDFGIKHDKQGYYVENKKIITEEEFSIIKNALELYSGIDEERKTEILSKLSD